MVLRRFPLQKKLVSYMSLALVCGVQPYYTTYKHSGIAVPLTVLPPNRRPSLRSVRDR